MSHTVDYLSQFSEGGGTPGGSARGGHGCGVYVQPPPAARKRGGTTGKTTGRAQGRKQLKGVWRTRHGRKVFFDDRGQQLQGVQAYRVSAKTTRVR